MAEVFANLHREHGVDLRLGASIAEITTEGGKATGVRLADGTTIAGDAVLVAVGAGPNVQLAEAAGLTVDNGIVVDENLRTSDPDIFAPVTSPTPSTATRQAHPGRALGQRPQAAQGRRLVDDRQRGQLRRPAVLLHRQYDLGMEYVGYVEPDGYDQVVFRGDVGKREFIAFWLADGKIPGRHERQRLGCHRPDQGPHHESGKKVDVAQLADPSVPLESL